MVRFAQTPQRDMHLNDMRNALYSYIITKQLKEQLLVRIDDCEKDKNIEGKEKEILELLQLFSIDYSRAVYESENLKYHQKLAMQLMSQKKAFACFCGEEKLKELEKYDGFCSTLSDETVLNCNAPFTVRINSMGEDIDMFNILNHDKSPTNVFASSLDDMLYDVSTIISTDDSKINSTFENHIRNQLNYSKEIDYIYISKLSNADEISVKSLIEEGYLPSAIANYLVLLGIKTSKDIFTIEDAIEWLDIKSLSKDSVEFDMEKLKTINKAHLNNLDNMRLSKIIGYADEDIGKLAKLYLNNSNTINEIKTKVKTIFSSKIKLKDYEKEYDILIEELKNAPYCENLKDLEQYLEEKTNLKGSSLLKPLSYVLGVYEDNLELNEVYPLIKNYIGEIAK